MSSNLIHVTIRCVYRARSVNMVFIVLAVSTADCGSVRMGSNPINHPKCPNGGIGRHSGLRSRGESLRVRVSLWVQHTYSLTDRTSGYEPDNGSSNLSKCTKYGYGAMVAYGSPKA